MTAGEAEGVAVVTAGARTSRTAFLIFERFRADFDPAKLNVVRKSAEAQIVSTISARELKKPNFPEAEKFSMTPWV